MITRRTLLAWGLAGAALLGGGAVTAVYRVGLERAKARLARNASQIVATRFGDLEYADIGGGPAILMIHGSGGGFDQGLLFAAPLAKAGYSIIAPSRFGYLRSSLPGDPSPENQADAFIELLDTLGIDKIMVVGGSAGALSALAFAIRHPGRIAALVAIVPAAYAPGRPPARPWSPFQEWLVRSVLQSDFLFWSAITLMPDRMTEILLATDPSLLADASEGERIRVRDILEAILPVSQRAKGLLADMHFAGNPAPMALESITAPTLAISLDDDLYLTADAARHIAATVPGARAIIYPSGGHVWVGHDREMFAAIDAFLKETAKTNQAL
jgi:pimeloyl-ACP methyl ester carboxylesterase